MCTAAPSYAPGTNIGALSPSVTGCEVPGRCHADRRTPGLHPRALRVCAATDRPLTCSSGCCGSCGCEGLPAPARHGACLPRQCEARPVGHSWHVAYELWKMGRRLRCICTARRCAARVKPYLKRQPPATSALAFPRVVRRTRGQPMARSLHQACCCKAGGSGHVCEDFTQAATWGANAGQQW